MERTFPPLVASLGVPSHGIGFPVVGFVLDPGEEFVDWFFENHVNPLPRSAFKINGIIPSLLEESLAPGVSPSGFLFLLDIVLQPSEHFDPRHKVSKVGWRIECQVFLEPLPGGKLKRVACHRQLFRALLDLISTGGSSQLTQEAIYQTTSIRGHPGLTGIPDTSRHPYGTASLHLLGAARTTETAETLSPATVPLHPSSLVRKSSSLFRLALSVSRRSTSILVLFGVLLRLLVATVLLSIWLSILTRSMVMSRLFAPPTVPFFATASSSSAEDLQARWSWQFGGHHCPSKADIPSNVNRTPAQGRPSLLTSDSLSDVPALVRCWGFEAILRLPRPSPSFKVLTWTWLYCTIKVAEPKRRERFPQVTGRLRRRSPPLTAEASAPFNAPVLCNAALSKLHL
ncbi:hypothetical protein Acr_03g0012790 [Actinidia rufa]|uniref:Uncharacterized protein n=1 Tax=Actinidia rufa TaxID=165716 RepID=A0A7J0EDJ5_9ERIC|nr:hypothetical protein Acr_03g0012790 [Actinidia rufa]